MSKVQNRPSLTVNSGMSVANAEDFLSKAAEGGKKIYGRKDEKTGEITLYAKSGTSTRHLIRDRISRAMSRQPRAGDAARHHATKQATGREGVQQILEKVLRPKDFSGSSTSAQRGIEALFASLEDGVKGSGTALRADHLGTKLRGFDNLGRIADIRGIAAAQHAANAEPPGAKLSDIDGAGFSSGLDDAFAPGLPSVAHVADAIVSGLKENHPSRADQMSLVLRNLDGLKGGVKEALLSRPHEGMSDADIDRLASEAVETARDQICGVKSDPASMKTIKNEVVDYKGDLVTKNRLDLPSLASNGRKIEPERYLAAGGFAHIIRFKGEDGKMSILKVPIIKDPSTQSESLNPTPEQINTARQAARAEIASHLAAEGSGHPNVLQLRGAVELPNGNIGILLDYAEGGSAIDLAKALSDPTFRAATGTPPQSGQITDADAEMLSLTVGQDMLQGLSHLHDTQGVTSLDNKHANALLVEDGFGANGMPMLKTVLSDFGTLIKGTDELSLKDTPLIGEPSYLAPEFDAAQGVRETDTRAVTADVLDALGGHLEGRLSPNEKDDLLQYIGEDYGKSLATGTIDAKVDIWGLGVSLAEMISGQSIDARRVAAFARSGEDAVQPNAALPNASLFQNFPASQATLDLVNAMLKGTASDRPGAFQALMNPALRQRGVGSAESRVLSGAVIEMQRALKSDDQGRIDKAKRDVDTARAALDALRRIPAAPPNPLPPIFRTSVGLPRPPVLDQVPPASASNLRTEVDALVAARASGDPGAVEAAKRALNEGISRTKGPAPVPLKNS